MRTPLTVPAQPHNAERLANACLLTKPTPTACRFAAKPFHATTLATFINETLAQHSDVYFLTFSQLIRWLEAPVKASQMRSWLTCNDVDFAAQGEGARLGQGVRGCEGGLLAGLRWAPPGLAAQKTTSCLRSAATRKCSARSVHHLHGPGWRYSVFHLSAAGAQWVR